MYFPPLNHILANISISVHAPCSEKLRFLGTFMRFEKIWHAPTYIYRIYSKNIALRQNKTASI